MALPVGLARFMQKSGNKLKSGIKAAADGAAEVGKDGADGLRKYFKKIGEAPPSIPDKAMAVLGGGKLGNKVGSGIEKGAEGISREIGKTKRASDGVKGVYRTVLDKDEKQFVKRAAATGAAAAGGVGYAMGKKSKDDDEDDDDKPALKRVMKKIKGE